MALVFNTTSPSAASVPAVAVIIQSAWRDALVGHPSGAWTLVEEFDSASSTVHWVVVKNSTSVSGVGVDYYVCIGRIAATGDLSVLVGEGYNSSTHVLSSYATQNSGSVLAINADGTYTGQTFTLATGFPTSTAGLPRHIVANGNNMPAASTVKQSTHVTEKYAAFMHYLGVGYSVTFGIMVGNFADSLIQPPAVDQPLIGVAFLGGNVTSVTSANGSLTRHPVDAADATMRSAQICVSPYTLYGPAQTVLATNWPAVACGNYYGGDRYQNNRVAACDVYLVMWAAFAASTSAPSAAQSGALRGRYKALKLSAVAEAMTPGDTMTIDSKKYMLLNKSTTSNSLAGPVASPQYGVLLDTGVVA